jgi:predicted Zn-dependent protease
MLDNLKLIGFRLLLIAAMFSVIVNIAYAAEAEEEQEYKFLKPPKEAQEVFDRIQKISGGSSGQINFRVHTAPIVNAYMDQDNNLVIFLGTLNFMIRDRDDKNMLANLIGHEVGHKMWGHVAPASICFSSAVNSRDCEREADQYGIWAAHRAGYDCSSASKFYKDMIETFGESRYTDPESSHPSNYERMEWTKKACEVLKETGKLIPVNYENSHSKHNISPIK